MQIRHRRLQLLGLNPQMKIRRRVPIAFTIGDAETAIGALTLSGTSSNAALVPDANITFGGSGAES